MAMAGKKKNIIVEEIGSSTKRIKEIEGIEKDTSTIITNNKIR